MSWTKRFALSVCALFLLLPHALFSQGLPASPSGLVLPSGTPVELQSMQTISSARAHKGDRVDFVVAKDVQAAGFTIIGAGARARGSIIGVKGKRPLGMGGDLIIKLDSVELASGDSVALVARKEFKGKSHTIRMGVAMAITAAIYLPAAPAFILSRGRDSTVLKGTELTAYTRTDSPVEIAGLPPARENVSELSEMIKMLPSRVTNAEGREGDMLNLIFQAREEDLQEAFAQAGWLKVEKSKRLIFWHLLWQRGHYTKLPMDRLYVFGRAQDYSYALPDPLSIVARRHHLRIWKTGRVVDGVPLWVAAATHDVSIHLVKHKFRLFHRIDPNVDAERDFIAGNLSETKRLTREEYVNCPQPVSGAQTATGQDYYSDSRMLLLELHQGPTSMPAGTQIASKLP
ncbi:MAG TPA: LssY C-terminal domain-containing protein [Candidatus Acidoferrum sp.]|nr:LssY C-terminal domain-containing protein [Candidatus Acidoferrum sp.]